MLVYRGQFPRGEIDLHDSISSSIEYPLAYGYANAGRVIEIGNQVGEDWIGHLVFGFQPHSTHYVSDINQLMIVPDNISAEQASLLPFAETAINLIQDAQPLLGEKVLILGQGTIGLMAAALMSMFPLKLILTTDCYPIRREASLKLSERVKSSLDPLDPDFMKQAKTILQDGADLSLELSGNPSALNDALALTAFSGRIVIGSWYGEKKGHIELGGSFHRSRIKLISSQVSSIAPELSGRWDKSRRFDLAWDLLDKIKPERWITHRFSQENAQQAFKLIHEKPDQTIQTILTYE